MDLSPLVTKAATGDAEAFAALVRRFQDMAVGYAYALTRDFHAAEDAAQEAFLEAFLHLHQLRDPSAFPGWFRRIVFKQADRLTRKRTMKLEPLPIALDLPSPAPGPPEAMSRNETSDRIRAAVDALPDHERAAVVLYYLGGYSQQEVGEFLEVPETAVKKRLFSARRRLREMLLDAVADTLRERRPSHDETFASNVLALLAAARSGDAARVGQLLRANRRLLEGRDWLGNSALIIAVNSGQQSVAELLLQAGVRPDLHEAAAIGDAVTLARRLDSDRGCVDAFSNEGFTPLALAAHYGHVEATRLLLARGAGVDVVSRHPLEVTPLHAALFGRQPDTARLLIEAGADLAVRRGGRAWPRAGWTPLHYAAGLGQTAMVELLLARGADPAAHDEAGRTPRDAALEGDHLDVIGMLERPATPAREEREETNMHAQLFDAIRRDDLETVERLLASDAVLAGARNSAGLSAVMMATYHGRPAIASTLIARGAELDLCEAAATGRTIRVRELLAADAARVNDYSADGFFPLALAVFFGHTETVEVLLAAGADVHQASRESMRVTPIQSAAAARRPDVARLLLAHGADANATYAESGRTPLHEAAMLGDLEMVRVLVAGGADVNARGKDGRTALAMAREKHREEVAGELVRLGAVE